MKKRIARMLRKAAHRIDPEPALSPSWWLVTPTTSSASTTYTSTFEAGRRAVQKHGPALKRLGE